MNKKILLAALTQMMITLAFGQRTFTVNDASANYNVKILVAKCKNRECSGSGTLKIFTKDNSTLVQTLRSPSLIFSLDASNNPSSKMDLYDETSPLVFGDFNFDGNEDIAVKNGNNSGYGGPSYDVYVYNFIRKQFVLSKELTKLASTNLGMFETDKEKKRLRTFSKSGCCWHLTTEYEVKPGQGLAKVYELIEDGTKGDNFVYVTESNLVRGKWKKKTSKHKTKD